MVMARAIERRVWLLNRTGQAYGSVRAGGSEAVQVAAAAALRPGTDWVVPRPGDLALSLAMGLSPLDLLMAVMGRASDPSSGGRLGPAGLGSRGARIVTTSPAAGAHVLHAAGIAYASHLSGREEVTLVSTDRRGSESGDWHEGVNFAAVHRLPLVCLVVDVTGGPAALLGQPESDPLVRRTRGYGVAGDVIDGGDFERAFEAVNQAVSRARSGLGPTVIHATVRELTSLNDAGAIQAPEQLEAQAGHDPIELVGRLLLGLHLIDDETNLRIHQDCLSVVATAASQARASAAPRPAAALDNVFHRNDD